MYMKFWVPVPYVCMHVCMYGINGSFNSQQTGFNKTAKTLFKSRKCCVCMYMYICIYNMYVYMYVHKVLGPCAVCMYACMYVCMA